MALNGAGCTEDGKKAGSCRCIHLVSSSPRICARAFTFRANDFSVGVWPTSCITSAHESECFQVFSSVE
jgi:hypothetical protein